MCINQEKSKCTILDRVKKHDFIPKLYKTKKIQMEIEEEMKLFGFDLRTVSKTQDTVKRALQRMWVIERLQSFEASKQN